jgi:2-methylisocitrate lyase-like PEP mutase family enzyme
MTSWKQLLDQHAPLVLPSAHDSLTALLIAHAGFPAFQVGNLSLSASAFGLPDIDLVRFGELYPRVSEILQATSLPVLLDMDDGYGDPRMVYRAVSHYERLGASALFLEDQQAPKHCGHMGPAPVLPVPDYLAKLRAAQAARSHPDLFLLARTDARGSLGVTAALERAKAYYDAGADGVYVEGLESESELEEVGKALASDRGIPLATSILEGHGKTPWVDPKVLGDMGYAMILYPTSLLFRSVKAVALGLQDLRHRRPMWPGNGINMEEFLDVLEYPKWNAITELPVPPRRS